MTPRALKSFFRSIDLSIDRALLDQALPRTLLLDAPPCPAAPPPPPAEEPSLQDLLDIRTYDRRVARRRAAFSDHNGKWSWPR